MKLNFIVKRIESQKMIICRVCFSWKEKKYMRVFSFLNSVVSCDVWDIVDAGDRQHVEDDVGAADVQHRQEIENKTCSLLSW